MRNSFHETPRSPSKAIMLRSGWGILWSSQNQSTAFPLFSYIHWFQVSAVPILLPTSATRVFHLSGSRYVQLQFLFRHQFLFLCTFTQLPLTPGPTAVCLLRLLKYCKYCRVAPVVVAVEESILWINHPDRKGLAGVRKGLGHWTFSRAVETPVPTSKSIHPSIHPSKETFSLQHQLKFLV